MIALVDQHRGPVHDMVGIARLVVLALKHLQARSLVRSEAKTVGFVMAGFVRKPVGVVLVGRKARPAAGAHGKQL